MSGDLFPSFECEVETGLTSPGAEGASTWPRGTESNLARKFQYCYIGCGLYYWEFSIYIAVRNSLQKDEVYCKTEH